MELLSINLQQKRGLHFDVQVRFSDGCTSQYKSKGPLADIAHGFNISQHYYGSRHGKGASESRHGKGASDGESAVIKSSATNTINCGTLITDAKFICVASERLY